MIQSKDILMPHHLPSLAAWFRFNSGITVTGAGVSQWDDASGNGRHLKQATDANRPAKQADGSILFDGVAHFLKCDAFALSQPETIYLLFRHVTWTSLDRVFDGEATDSGQMSQTPTTPSLVLFAGGTGPATTDLALNTYGVVAAVFNGASSVLQVNRTPVTGNVGANNMGGFTLGALGAGNARFANIQVKEAAVFAGAHDAVTRIRVLDYLRSAVGVL